MLVKYYIQYDTGYNSLEECDYGETPFNIIVNKNIELSDITTNVGDVDVSVYMSDNDLQSLKTIGYCFDTKGMGRKSRTLFLINDFKTLHNHSLGIMGELPQVLNVIQILRSFKLKNILNES